MMNGDRAKGKSGRKLCGFPHFRRSRRALTLPGMKTYLVEAYLPRAREEELHEAVARLEADAESAQPGSARARYLRSTFVPEDEICFHVFEAVSAEAVREAGERASLTFDRIVEAREER